MTRTDTPGNLYQAAIKPQNGSAFDVAVIGGGVNGTGIARDAAGRGLSVLLVEKNDLASATSSASTKLVHGGLRYLENYEFRLVRESLIERDVLMRSAPHLTRDLRFVLPQQYPIRPDWMVRCGLYLYDLLALGSKLPKSKAHDLTGHIYGQPLKPTPKTGFSYSDGWVDDARLTILNALDAAERGATILTGTECLKARAVDSKWQLQLQHNGQVQQAYARMLVNASGPWVRQFIDLIGCAQPDTPNVRLVRGSHIILPRLYGGEHAYILQQKDRRIVFAIPYERQFTLIGTTEEQHNTSLDSVHISAQEQQYLLRATSQAFGGSFTDKDVVGSYSGVRPLYDDGADNARTVTRDYRLVEQNRNGAPLLSVFGGKLTSYRALSEKVCDQIARHFPQAGKAWTKNARLPGGDFDQDILDFIAHVAKAYAWLPYHLVDRYARQYGTRMLVMLLNRHNIADLGEEIIPDLYEAELSYLVQHEWAKSADDILSRRSKLYLTAMEGAAEKIAAWLEKYRQGEAA